MALPHRQCAASLILDADGKVLLVQQNYGGRRWGAPGGVVEVGETPMQAACREAFEETGLQIEIVRVIGMYLLQGGGWPDILAHVFQAKTLGDNVPVRDEEEIAALEWRALTDLPTPMVHETPSLMAVTNPTTWSPSRASTTRSLLCRRRRSVSGRGGFGQPTKKPSTCSQVRGVGSLE